MEKVYCSACLKPCEVVLRDDSFDHAFGTKKVLTPAPACHPYDDLLSRDEWAREVQFQWDIRRASRAYYNEKPLTVKDVLSQVEKVMRAA